MYCRKCGQKLKETSRFCKMCGTPVMMESTIEDEVIIPMKRSSSFLAAAVMLTESRDDLLCFVRFGTGSFCGRYRS